MAAFAGAALLLLSTLLHPMHADPSVSEQAFAEYARDQWWIWSHVGQFLGIALLSLAMLGLTATLPEGRSAAWGGIGAAGAVCAVACAAVLQAVDGIALKAAIDNWVAVEGDAKQLAFRQAVAIRRIEIGLASLLSLATGLAMLAFSAALLAASPRAGWLGFAALVVGAGFLASGLAQASSGFSGPAMMLSMASGLGFVVWQIVVGLRLLRFSDRPAQS